MMQCEPKPNPPCWGHWYSADLMAQQMVARAFARQPHLFDGVHHDKAMDIAMVVIGKRQESALND